MVMFKNLYRSSNTLGFSLKHSKREFVISIQDTNVSVCHKGTYNRRFGRESPICETAWRSYVILIRANLLYPLY